MKNNYQAVFVNTFLFGIYRERINFVYTPSILKSIKYVSLCRLIWLVFYSVFVFQ